MGSSMTGEINGNTWRGSIFTRHGGDHFVKWWKHERGKEPTKVNEGVNEDVVACWQVAVHAR